MLTGTVPCPQALLLCVLASTCPALAARQQGPAQDPVSLDLAGFERLRSKGEASRIRLIPTLGKHDDKRVTTLLLDELDRAETEKYLVVVITAIGHHYRPDALSSLADLLIDERTGARARIAVAKALSRQGNRGIDMLIDLLEKSPRGMSRRVSRLLRIACLQALVAVDEGRAWRALATLSLSGSPRERLVVLSYLEKAPASRVVTQARLDAYENADRTLAATALVQLVAAGHTRVHRMVENLAVKVGPRTSDTVRGLLIRSIVPVLSRELYGVLLELSASETRMVTRAVADTAKTAAANVGFVRFLVQGAVKRRNDAERKVALRWLQHVDGSEAADSLGGLRKDLRRTPTRDLGLIKLVHRVFARDHTWAKDLLVWAGSRNAELRTVALTLLTDIGDRRGLAIAHRSLSHKKWYVRSAAYAFCGKVRHVSSIPKLIARLDDEEFRLRQDLLDALQDLTRMRFLPQVVWNRWWRESEEGFELPPSLVRNRTGKAKGGGTTRGFFSIPLHTHRAAFVIDISGSMNRRIGTNRNRTRLDEAQSQLKRVIDGMAKDRSFDIIVYESRVRSLTGGSVRASKKQKEKAKSEVDMLRPAGGTNIHDALLMAFDNPDVDTIYLLTDGQPSTGPITDPKALADEVARWNLSRRLVIHGVAIGIDSKLLRRLAEESGGSFVYIR